MTIWDVKVGGAVIRMTDEAKAHAIAGLINDGGLYEEPAEVVASRGPRRSKPPTKATVKARKK